MDEKSKSVLICDDDPLMRKLLCELLQSMGCTVAGEAVNGDQCIKLFNRLRPDMVLLDINMPGKNGLAALREMRKARSTAKVVMLTAMDDGVIAESCLHNGAIGYIRKGEAVASMAEELQGFVDTF